MYPDEFHQPAQYVRIESRSRIVAVIHADQIDGLLSAGQPFEEAHQLHGRFIDNTALPQLTRYAFGPGLIHLIERDERIVMLIGRNARLIKQSVEHLPMI